MRKVSCICWTDSGVRRGGRCSAQVFGWEAGAEAAAAEAEAGAEALMSVCAVSRMKTPGKVRH